MTKKSASRLMRDNAKEQLKENKCWDDLNAMYHNMLQLIQQHASISQIASNKELIELVADKTTLATNLRSLSNDLRSMNDNLAKIHNQHANKIGGSTDPEVVFSTIEIFEQYNLFMEQHDAVIMPTVYHLIEQLNEAEKLLIAKRLNADVNVISDAEVISEQPINAGDTTTTLATNFGAVVHESVTKPDFANLKESFDKIHPEIKNV